MADEKHESILAVLFDHYENNRFGLVRDLLILLFTFIVVGAIPFLLLVPPISVSLVSAVALSTALVSTLLLFMTGYAFIGSWYSAEWHASRTNKLLLSLAFSSLLIGFAIAFALPMTWAFTPFIISLMAAGGLLGMLITTACLTTTALAIGVGLFVLSSSTVRASLWAEHQRAATIAVALAGGAGVIALIVCASLGLIHLPLSLIVFVPVIIALASTGTLAFTTGSYAFTRLMSLLVRGILALGHWVDYGLAHTYMKNHLAVDKYFSTLADRSSIETKSPGVEIRQNIVSFTAECLTWLSWDPPEEIERAGLTGRPFSEGPNERSVVYQIFNLSPIAASPADPHQQSAFDLSEL